MRASQPLIVELDDAIRRGPRSRRAETLRRVTDLFLLQSGRFTAEQVGLFDDVMIRLIGEIEQDALAQLGRQLALLSDAPAQVIRTLAYNDTIAVAGPVLARSPRLGDMELAEIAEAKGQAHLLAISRRRSLGPAVGDLLISRGNRYVKRSLVANVTAHLSGHAHGALAAAAKDDATLAGRLVLRADVPPDLRDELIAASDVVGGGPLGAAAPERHPEIRRVLASIAGGVAVVGRPRDYGSVVQALSGSFPDGQVPEGEVLRFAAARDFTTTVTALSLIVSRAPELVEKLVGGERLEPVLVLSRAVGFVWPTARAVIHGRPGRKPTPQALTAACSDFNRLSAGAARQMLRYWRASNQ